MKKMRRLVALATVVIVMVGSTMTVNAAPAAKRDTIKATSENSMETQMSSLMLEKINELRVARGLAALEESKELKEYAKIRAKEITGKFSHVRPDGTQGYDLIPMEKAWAGENLSMCQMFSTDTVEDIAEITFNDLYNSPTHLENMVEKYFSQIGIYTVKKNGVLYVAYMFSN